MIILTEKTCANYRKTLDIIEAGRRIPNGLSLDSFDCILKDLQQKCQWAASKSKTMHAQNPKQTTTLKNAVTSRNGVFRTVLSKRKICLQLSGGYPALHRALNGSFSPVIALNSVHFYL